ncbi:MAG: sulfur carrier protein ThiS [Kiritimatiellae bacterium]|nr:sulfur carrier protein ThiS [Kiritimatiellia bacterium]MDW8459284.1 sulfur carrier protein ThiS [Verrucomicrobiota bacterium]
MKLRVNGEVVEAADGLTLSELITRRGDPPFVAAAVNGEFVPKGLHSETVLRDGDDVEILGPIQGG